MMNDKQVHVALLQQGMVLDQKVVAVGHNQDSLQKQAEAEAKKLNDAMTGFGEGWTAVVLTAGR